MTTIPQLRTVGIIASELGVSIHRVAYVIRAKRIQPIGRAGTLRLFDKEAVETVRQALQERQGVTQ